MSCAADGTEPPTNRLDALLALAADDAISAVERAELEVLLAKASPQAVRSARRLLQIEAGLRRTRPADVTDAVMHALNARADTAVARVMNQIESGRPRVGPTAQARAVARRRSRFAVLGFLLAGSAAFAFVVAKPNVDTTSESAADPHAPNAASRWAGKAPPAFAPPLESTVTEPAASEQSIYYWDFEDGNIPAAMDSAVVAPGPARLGSQFSAMGGMSKWSPETNLLTFNFAEAGQAIPYDPRLVLRFWCWAGRDTASLVVQMFNETRRKNFHVLLQPPTEQWVKVTVVVGDLLVNDGTKAVSQPGDKLTNVIIDGGKLPGHGLYIDDLSISRVPEGLPLPKTSVQ